MLSGHGEGRSFLLVPRRADGNRLAGFSRQSGPTGEGPRVVGIRAFLWTLRITLDATQLAQLRDRRQGMTLDIVSRGTLNPKDQVSALASAVPTTHHPRPPEAPGPVPALTGSSMFGGSATGTERVREVLLVLRHVQPVAAEDEGWKSPRLDAYKASFDVLATAFGQIA
jgi:hypothetical protein